jgi:hypothetical protein
MTFIDIIGFVANISGEPRPYEFVPVGDHRHSVAVGADLAPLPVNREGVGGWVSKKSRANC